MTLLVRHIVPGIARWFLLRCTLHGGVVDGHTVLTFTRSSA